MAKILILMTLLLSFRIEAKCLSSQTDTSFMCVKFLYAYDGDTIFVDIAETHPLFGRKISIRIKGIDTPEINNIIKCQKAKAIAAKLELEEIVNKSKQIDLINVSRDKYFRILANVMVDGKNLGQLLIAQKNAVAYDGKKKVIWSCKN